MSASEPFEHGKYQRDSGDVGGDNAVGITPSRRFAQLQTDGTWLLITDYAMPFVSDWNETPRVYDIQNMTEVMVCRDLDDPGSSEITCDYEYEFVGERGYTNIREAERAAARYVRGLDIKHYGWED